MGFCVVVVVVVAHSSLSIFFQLHAFYFYVVFGFVHDITSKFATSKAITYTTIIHIIIDTPISIGSPKSSSKLVGTVDDNERLIFLFSDTMWSVSVTSLFFNFLKSHGPSMFRTLTPLFVVSGVSTTCPSRIFAVVSSSATLPQIANVSSRSNQTDSWSVF